MYFANIKGIKNKLEINMIKNSVGIIANPVSARDIRRIISNASNLQTSERVNIVMRLLSTLFSCNVNDVYMMPDKAGLTAMLLRSIKKEHAQSEGVKLYPDLHFVDLSVTSTVDDTYKAASLMVEAGVKVIFVLGGDGTHRAVVKELMKLKDLGKSIPAICGISTGTNNAFPQMLEPTVAALAVAQYVNEKISIEKALVKNKVIEVCVNDKVADIAIVDAVISKDMYVGSRAIWDAKKISEIYLTYADPTVIGFSSIGGLLEPIERFSIDGLALYMSEDSSKTSIVVKAPIAPGLLSDVPIEGHQKMVADVCYPIRIEKGIVALDGEREFSFNAGQKVSIRLRKNVFSTVNVNSCMQEIADKKLLCHTLV
uniref:NAD(+)/NADH kinase n=2 Tax=Polynucleobacter sp. TaxID=2029855 RepID=UPI004047E25D